MKRSGVIVLLTALLFIFHGTAFGEVIEVFPNKDANVKYHYYNPSLGDQNFNNQDLNTGDQPYNIGGNNYAYIQFDVQDAPDQVTSAKLRLYNRKEKTTYQSGTIDLYTVLDAWEEEAITFNTKPGFGNPRIYARIYQNSSEYIEFDVTDLYRTWKNNPGGNHGVMLTTRGSSDYYRCGARYPYFGCYPGTFYSAESEYPAQWPRLILEIDNQPPTADAGENIDLKTHQVSDTVILGSAADPDGNPLTYRWLEGATELSASQAVADDGTAALDLSALPAFAIGEHLLTLEVSDGQATASDTMTLTIENSAPTVVASGGGVYEIFSAIVLGGEVSDFDGDVLTYEWLEGEQVMDSGTVNSNYRGYSVSLPECTINYLGFGVHTLTLSVSDGVNAAVTDSVSVEITDTTQPTLAPTADPSILWPPNHRMRRVVITADAADNSGQPVDLSAMVTSNEPQDGLWRWDRSPDWSEPAIDAQNGIITVQLRAERGHRSDGRVYTIHVTATDQHGNSSTAQVDVAVPRCRGKRYHQLRRDIMERIQARRDRIRSRQDQHHQEIMERIQEHKERIQARKERIRARIERHRANRKHWRNRRR